MRPINISARDLEAFIALAQTQHFTRAAERCHLSQSAFSQKIARIEAGAGVRLFERSTRHVVLTPEGEAFAGEVRRIAQDLTAAYSNLRDLARLRAGSVAVAALPSVAAAWMPQVIARYRADHPAVRIALFDTLASGALALLREGKADLAITAGGELREFDTEVLRSERYFLVCRPGHPLAGKRRLALAQLEGQPMVHLARNSSVRQHLDTLPSLQVEAGGLEVEHLATLAALVAQDLGVAVVPELTLFHFLRAGLKAVPLHDAQLKRPIVLARRRGLALSVAAQAMRSAILRRAAMPK